MKENLPDSHYVGALLITPKGEVIVQHRDNIPNIKWPDSLSTFGGGVEGDETFEAGLAREIQEELNIDVNNYRCEFYKTFEQRVGVHDQAVDDVDCHVYLIHDVNPDDLTVLEGQGYRLLNSETDLLQIKASPIMREIFQDYFSSLAQ